MKRFYFLYLVLFIFIITLYPQQQYDSTGNKHRNYRRTEANQLLNTNYQQPKGQVYPLGWNRGTFPKGQVGKVTAGTGVWTELNPKVPRVDYLGLHFVNKDTGWASGGSGAIIKTTNGGDDWTIAETPVNNLLLKTHSYNGEVVIVTGYDGIILRSSDGGDTFEQVPSGVGSGTDLWGVQMLNDTLGWVCGMNQTLLKTTDAGQTWQEVTAGLNQHYWSLDFLNEQYGMIASGGGKVLKTMDGGASWTQIQAGDTRALYTIDIIDTMHIAAAGVYGKNVYSSDGGVTWTINPDLPAFTATNWIDFVDTDTGYSVQDVYDIRKTTNRGQSWFNPTTTNVTSEWHIQLLEDGTGYSCGEEIGGPYTLNFFKRTDGLDNWTRVFLNDNFNDLYFTTETTGFVLSGSLYKTTDSGINWDKIENAPGGGDLLFLDSLTGFIGSNLIYKTTDGGYTWYTTNGSGGAGKIFFINSTVGWAVRSNVIYKTIDAGENWFVQLTLPADHFRSIFFVDTLNGWAVSRYIWQTTDGGINWIERTDIPVFFGNEIYFIGNNGFAIEPLKLYKTTDNGENWFTQLNSQYIIRSFGWLNNQHGFIIGDAVYETADSGNTWQEILELRNIGLRKFQAPINYLGYTIGNGGLIYMYIDSSYVPVELVSFTGKTENDIVILEWITASELNNYGFEIQRLIDNNQWKKVGFVPGKGTSTETNYYSFSELITYNEEISYRLKQIDYDGSYIYSQIITILIEDSPSHFDLFQNYPNPFNSSTIITYQIPKDEFVTLKVYDVLGNEVTTLIEENKKAGLYRVSFSANDLSTGIYFYRIESGSFSSTKKLMLLK